MLATVVLARRVPKTFTFLTYQVPETLTVTLSLYQLVSVPFGKTTQYGIITGIDEPPKIPLPKNQILKDIKDIVRIEPILSTAQWLFLQDISELYHTPLGWLLKNTIELLIELVRCELCLLC